MERFWGWLARRVVRGHPPGWRRRYESELLAWLDQGGAGVSVMIDLVRASGRAWLAEFARTLGGKRSAAMSRNGWMAGPTRFSAALVVTFAGYFATGWILAALEATRLGAPVTPLSGALVLKVLFWQGSLALWLVPVLATSLVAMRREARPIESPVWSARLLAPCIGVGLVGLLTFEALRGNIASVLDILRLVPGLALSAIWFAATALVVGAVFDWHRGSVRI